MEKQVKFIPYEEGFFPEEEDHNCSAAEFAGFLDSGVFVEIKMLQAKVIFEIRNTLEDPDSPLEDIQFQRGRAFEARALLLRLEALMEELKEFETTDIEEELKDVN